MMLAQALSASAAYARGESIWNSIQAADHGPTRPANARGRRRDDARAEVERSRTPSRSPGDGARAMAHERAMASAAAAAADGSSDWHGEGRCMIMGCTRQLLCCYGVKAGVGHAVGAAESAHIMCASCLSRWWEVQNESREVRGLEPLVRRMCPVCKCELRRAAGDMRAEADKFHFGLLKMEGSWAEPAADS